MTPTKLLIGQIILVLAIIIASIWTATQWAAARLAYQPELGPPWFVLFGAQVYHPWSIFPWWFSFDAYAPIIFDEAGAIAAAGGFIGCGAAIFGSIWRARQASTREGCPGSRREAGFEGNAWGMRRPTQAFRSKRV